MMLINKKHNDDLHCINSCVSNVSWWHRKKLQLGRKWPQIIFKWEWMNNADKNRSCIIYVQIFTFILKFCLFLVSLSNVYVAMVTTFRNCWWIIICDNYFFPLMSLFARTFDYYPLSFRSLLRKLTFPSPHFKSFKNEWLDGNIFIIFFSLCFILFFHCWRVYGRVHKIYHI